MKKMICAVITAIMLISLSLPCFAAVDSPYLTDDADLLSDYEEQYLLTSIENLIYEYGYDIIIHTTLYTDGKDIVSYCDDYYDNGNYSENGLIFVISMAERDYYTSTCGSLVDLLPSYEIDNICNSVVPFLSEGAYYDAFSTYLQNLSDYFAGGYSPDIHYGDDYDYDYSYDYDYDYGYDYSSDADDLSDILIKEAIVVVGACALAFLITSLIKRKMNTAVKQSDADNYVVNGTFVINGSSDIFVCSNINRTPINRNNTNHGGRVSGGSGHISSGGVRHGGSGGKF